MLAVLGHHPSHDRRRRRRACARGSSCGVLYAAMYAHICTEQTATSRTRERRVATHRPSGAANATVCVTTGARGSRLRSAGAATPATSTPQAVALRAVER